MIKKITHLFNFDPIKSIDNDSLANEVVFNSKFNNKRSTDNDPYSPSVVFNMRFDLPLNSFYFNDDCGKTITVSGNPSITAYRNEQPACYFNGSSDYITFPSGSEMRFYQQDFTIECWINRNINMGSGTYRIINEWNGSAGFIFACVNNKISFQSPSGTVQSVASTSINTWHHVAVCRQGNTLYISLDGQVISAPFFDEINPQVGATYIGRASDVASQYFSGYMSDIRITKGVARYTANFTPPDTIPEITPKGPRIYDQILGDVLIHNSGGGNLEETSGPFNNPALYFNGSGFISVPGKFTFLNCETPFTIEMWFKIDKNSALTGSSVRDGALINFGMPTSGTAYYFCIRLIGSSSVTGTGIGLEINDSNINFYNEYPCLLEKGKWYHLAVCRETNTSSISAYIDGKKLAVSKDGGKNYWIQQFSVSNDAKLGADNYPSYERFFKGWLSDIRITKECRYFGQFSVPTVANNQGDPYIADTTLLMHFNDTNKTPEFGLTNDIKAHPITLTGDISLSSGGKFGGSCAYFDGSAGGDKLAIAYSTDIDISFCPFNLEFWYKPQSLTSSGQAILDWRSAWSNAGLIIFQTVINPTKITVFIGNNTAGWEVTLVSQTTLVIGNWYHIAVTRDNNHIFGLWINGVLEASKVWEGIIATSPAPIWLGVGRDGSSNPLKAYIDDFRLSKVTDFLTNYQDEFIQLLLHFNGTDNGTTFIDSSFYNNAITLQGDVKIKTDQSKFGGSSAYFDGSGDYLTVPFSSFNFQNDWTVGVWVYPMGSGIRPIMTFRNASNYNTPLSILLTAANLINVLVPSGSAWTVNSSSRYTLPQNTWSHIVFQKNNTYYELYINGILDTRVSASVTPYVPAYDLKIGYDPGGPNYFQGYMDDFYIVDGVSSINYNFTPASSAFADSSPDDPYFSDVVYLLHLNGTNDSTSFTDVKGNAVTVFGNTKISNAQSKFGGTSGYFDGSGDCLRMATINFGSADWTMEAWIYLLAMPTSDAWPTNWTNHMVILGVGSGSAADGTNILLGQTQIILQINDNRILYATHNISTNQWYHVAAVRSGSFLKLFVNGVELAWTNYGAGNVGTGAYFWIGSETNDGAWFNGYMNDVRVTKNVARYGGFSIPTSEKSFQDIYWSNVSLKMPFNGTNNSNIFTDAKNKTITVIGNTKISNVQSKFGGTSGYFDGSGDYLSIADNADFDFGSQPFTIDLYIFFNELSSIPIEIIRKKDNTDGNSFDLYWSQADGLTFEWSSTGSSITSWTGLNDISFQTGQWYHITLIRSGSNLSTYINSIIQSQIKDFAGASIFTSSQPLLLGSSLNGYLDSLTITKGIARTVQDEIRSVTMPTAKTPTWTDDLYWKQVILLLPFDEMNQFNDVFKHNFTPLGNVEISSNQSKFGGLSARFKGTGYLTTPHDDHLHFPNSFTIEGWIRPESVTGVQIILRKPDNTVTYPYPAYEIRLNDTDIQFTSYHTYSAGNTICLNQTFGSVTLNTWSHFAIVKYGSIWKGFVDGVLGWTGSDSHSPYYTNHNTLPLVIGGDSVNRLYGYSGYLDELRFTKKARYTEAFTPESIPFLDYGSGDVFGSLPGFHTKFDFEKIVTNITQDIKSHTLTLNGNTILTPFSKWGGDSYYFDGSGDYITSPAHADFAFGTGDFTIECWAYSTTSTGYYPFVFSIGDSLKAEIYFGDGGYSYKLFSITGNTSRQIASYSQSSFANTWTYFTMTRSSGTVRIFVNGNIVDTYSNSENLGSSTGVVSIGARAGSFYWTGYIDEFRITKGVARYTANFTPPIAPHLHDTDLYWANTSLLIHTVMTNGLADEKGHILSSNITISSDQSKFGGLSGYFDGNSKCVTSPASTDFGFGTGDFTMEGWIYVTALDADMGIVDVRSVIPGANNGTFFIDHATNKLAFYDGTTKFGSTGSALSLNQWYHVALTRQSGTMRCFLDGTLDFQATVSTDLGSSKPLGLGGSGATGSIGSSPFFGYMSDIRITKGVARYTANFTPPSSGIPAFTNNPTADSEWLHCPLSGYYGNTTSFKDTSPSNFTLTPTGMNYSTWSAKFTRYGYAAQFNGSSSRLAFVHIHKHLNFQKDWTIEFWMYPTSLGSSRTILSIDGLAGTSSGLFISNNGSSKVILYLPRLSNNTSTMGFASSQTMVANTWTHVRFVKTGSLISLFINGIFDSSYVLPEQPALPASGRTCYIGCFHIPSEFYQGYLQDLIITYNITPSLSSNMNGYQAVSLPLNNKVCLDCNFEGADNATQYQDYFGTQLTANGNAVISTDDKKWGNSSAFFTGSADYFSVNNLALFAHYDKNFVIEMWIKTTESAGNEQVIFKQLDSSSSRQIVIKFGDSSNNHALMVNVGDPNSDWVTTSVSKSDFISNFRFLQVQKQGYLFSVFVDGSHVGHSKILLENIYSRAYDLLLLHFEGSNDSTTFTDSSISPKSFTVSGNARIRTTASKFGSSSGYFDGNGDYITAASSDLSFGSGDFTVECWFNIQAASNPNVDGNKLGALFCQPSHFELLVGGDFSSSSTTYIEFWSRARSKDLLAFKTSLAFNTWYHIAIAREKGFIRGFLNGVLQMTTINTNTIGGTELMYIGCGNTSGSYQHMFNGYIDEMRFTRGVARYTQNFIPPTTPYIHTNDNYMFSTPSSLQIGGDGINGLKGYIDDLRIYQGTCSQSVTNPPTQVIPDNSFDAFDSVASASMVKQKKAIFTNKYSVNNSSDDYRYIPISRKILYCGGDSAIEFNRSSDEWFFDNDWTVEFWMYRLDTGVFRAIVSNRATGNSTCSFLIEAKNNGTTGFLTSLSGSWVSDIRTPAQSANTWYHIAVVRNKNIISIYQNGALSQSTDFGLTPFNHSYGTQSVFSIGGDQQTYFWGYLKNVQIINGYAKYTNNFYIDTIDLELFEFDFYEEILKKYNNSMISHYKLSDSGSVLIDSINQNNLTCIDSSEIDFNQESLIEFNNTINDAISFDGGYGEGLSENVQNKNTLLFNFFLKTSSSTGVCLKKEGAYLIEIESGKIKATFETSSGSLSVTSVTSVNDNITRQITVQFINPIIELYVDGQFDASYDPKITPVVYKFTEMTFDMPQSNVMLQMRFNDLTDDCKNPVYLYGASQPLFINDSPFNTKSIAFNGLYHLEVPTINLAAQQSATALYYPSVIDFTIDFWIKISTSYTGGTILNWGNTGSGAGSDASLRGGLSIYLTSGVLRIQAGNLSQGGNRTLYNKQFPAALPDNVWCHIAVTCKNHFIRAYLNGIEQTLVFKTIGTWPSNSLINSTVYTSDPLLIGGYGWNKGLLSNGTDVSSNTSLIALKDLRIIRGSIYD